ncbi:phosphoglycerate kinase [Candidatus Woesebacteria bacterium]|nr:MAG: phosphoglycerate kinase [Candidatus Woesebacteria bacterium]
MSLIASKQINAQGKLAFLRVDLDEDNFDNPRIKVALQVSKELLKQNPKKLVICGHRGRPKGKVDKLSMSIFKAFFENEMKRHVEFITYEDFPFGNKFSSSDHQVFLMENLRFWEGETGNASEFVDNLYSYFSPEIYINEAFASSHREHASIFGLPKLIKTKGGQIVFGERFIKEIEMLEKVLNDSSKPSRVYISGIKEDKLKYIDAFKDKFDEVLVAGRLPDLMGEIDKDPITQRLINSNVVVANLNQDKEDITIRSIEIFEEAAKGAKTIIVSGPIGKFEDEGQRLGTKRVFTAIANSNAYKIAGGGDTEEAIKYFKLENKFDWISTGGGAMLYYLENKTMPGIDVSL